MPSRFDYVCPGCDFLLELEVEPPFRPHNLGSPDSWGSYSPGEFDPSVCLNCHLTFDPDAVWGAWEDYLESLKDDVVDREVDRRLGK